MMAPAQVAVRRQTAAVAHQVHTRQGHEGGQLLEQFLVMCQAVEQFRMPLETRNQPREGYPMPVHYLGEHDFMGRFCYGDRRGNAVDTPLGHPHQQVRAVVGECCRADQMVVENGGVNITDAPIRNIGQHGLALKRVILMTIANSTRDAGVQGEPVPALLVNHPAARFYACNRLNRDAHLRMFWQLRQRGEGLEDTGLIDRFNRNAHAYALLAGEESQVPCCMARVAIASMRRDSAAPGLS
jgi:hypothetical protein